MRHSNVNTTSRTGSPRWGRSSLGYSMRHPSSRAQSRKRRSPARLRHASPPRTDPAEAVSRTPARRSTMLLPATSRVASAITAAPAKLSRSDQERDQPIHHAAGVPRQHSRAGAESPAAARRRKRRRSGRCARRTSAAKGCRGRSRRCRADSPGAALRPAMPAAAAVEQTCSSGSCGASQGAARRT